jgi:UDP-3-O-[3-hydroxymyristoyl] glucosamine N-acyltransferase
MVDEEEKVVGDRKFEGIYTFSSGGRGSVVLCKRESNVSNNATVNNRAIVNNNATVNNNVTVNKNAIIKKSR